MKTPGRSFVIILLLIAPAAAGCVDGLSGRALAVDHSPDYAPTDTPLQLPANETSRRAPALAAAMREALEDGDAVVTDEGAVEASEAFLNALAEEAGAEGYRSTPFNSTVEWRGDVFIMGYLST